MLLQKQALKNKYLNVEKPAKTGGLVSQSGQTGFEVFFFFQLLSLGDS